MIVWVPPMLKIHCSRSRSTPPGPSGPVEHGPFGLRSDRHWFGLCPPDPQSQEHYEPIADVGHYLFASCNQLVYPPCGSGYGKRTMTSAPSPGAEWMAISPP
jgi:hypothetical protein